MVVGQFRIRDLELVVALHEEGNMTQAALASPNLLSVSS
jgi:hypothetical protein